MKAARYGVDVAVRRADDLDRYMLTDVSAYSNAYVLDIGCGAGGQSARLALAGARVMGVDILDQSAAFSALRPKHNWEENRLLYIQGDCRTLAATQRFDMQFTHACVQRVLHYLPYTDASAVLRWLHTCVQERIYLSVSGLESQIGDAYSHTHMPIHTRFTSLPADAAETFSIHEPLCLYTQAELKTLLQDTGWEPVAIWTSAFGNHKAICRKIRGSLSDSSQDEMGVIQ